MVTFNKEYWVELDGDKIHIQPYTNGKALEQNKRKNIRSISETEALLLLATRLYFKCDGVMCKEMW